MSKALVTFAVGEHTELLEIVRPSFVAYAERHDYEYLEVPPKVLPRPASWMKVPALINALKAHDEVLWVDADTIIYDGSEDIAEVVRPGAWMGIVPHVYHAGDVPNCGVLFVRKPMIAVLEEVWRMTQYIDHPWWEQGAIHELLGYGLDANGKVAHQHETELYRRTHFLPLAWNSDEFHCCAPERRIVHVCGQPMALRKAVLRGYAERMQQDEAMRM